MLQFQINKHNAIASTNEAIKKGFQKKSIAYDTVVWALHQTQGKGQRTSTWVVEANKNLTFSILLRPEYYDRSFPFLLSAKIALSIKQTLDYFKVPDISVKWPNDILSARKKICGVLIENIYRGQQLKGCVVGIGLNVNQLNYDEMPRATSMALETPQTFDLDEILTFLLEKINLMLTETDPQQVLFDYNENLFGRATVQTFKKENRIFSAEIKKVDKEGSLGLFFDGNLHKFKHKEVELVY